MGKYKSPVITVDIERILIFLTKMPLSLTEQKNINN